MTKILGLFLILPLLLNIHTLSTEEENPAIEIEIGTKVQYDKNRNYFKFNYEGEIGAKILFTVDDDINMYLINPNGKKTEINNYDYYKENRCFVDLTETGIYYIEAYCKEMKCEIGGSFNTYIFGGITDSSGLTKTAYYRDFSIDSYGIYYGMNEYKVSGLKEAKYAYFYYEGLNEYEYSRYYIYYPESPEPPVDPYDSYSVIHYDNESIFEVYDAENKESYKNLKAFKFEPNKEYIIKIHALRYYDIYYPQEIRCKYLNYYIFPITKDNFRVITGDEDFFLANATGPMLGLIQPNLEKSFNMIMGSVLEENMILVAETNDTIEPNLENIFTKIQELNISDKGELEIIKNNPNTTIAFMVPADFESRMKFYLVDNVMDECSDSFLIPANTRTMIICEGEKKMEYFNNITTFTSDKKNMHIIYSELDEATDYIIQNYLGIPIFIEKSTQDQEIKVKKYPPKFAFFGAENPFIFKTFYSFGQKAIDPDMEIDLNNYKNLTQTNVRINSKYVPWYEFYNFYFNKLDVKLNVYIKQIYGGSELYECSADDVDEKDLTFLTTPISNVKCKNQKSVFDRLFTLDGTKILSGYITPDSYFDIYVEVEKESTNIDVSPAMSQLLKMNHASKYLRKNIQYNINFLLNHMIKLEPGSGAEVTITKGTTNYILNAQNPTIELTGKGYTIKSNNDAMVYFLGRLSEWEVVQREIDMEQSKGKIIKVSNVDDDIMIDIGFEGFYPSSVPIDFERRENGVHYFDNIYEKVKGKLVEGEKVYIYHFYNQNQRLKIEYVSKSLDNKNNDFNIYYIPGTNEENTLLINTYEIRYIKPDLHFCSANTIFKLSYLLSNEEEESAIFTKENITELTKLSKIKLFEGDNKISVTSNQPFVFSYSYYDLVDNDYFKDNKAFLSERKIFENPTIEEVGDKNNIDDMIKIKFKPNYNQSSTRYIIIIAQQNSQNTLDKFKDNCFIAKLLNNRNTGVKVDTIYDIGDKDLIEAEVDISDILHSGNKYLVNIISQELRFDKKINFYQPKEFNHVGKKPIDNDPDKGDDGDNGGSSSLALAIALPIVGVIIIALVVIFILKRKGGDSSEKIEQLTSNV